MKMNIYKVTMAVSIILTFGILGSIDLNIIPLGRGALMMTACLVIAKLSHAGIELEERREANRIHDSK